MLHPNQYEAVQLLAHGIPMSEAAAKLRISERTVRRWRDIKEFAAELRDAVKSYREQVAMRLGAKAELAQSVGDVAMQRLLQIIKHTDIKCSTRAAQIALQFEHKIVQVVMEQKDVDIAKPLTGGLELPADLSALSQENSDASPSATGQNRTFPDMPMERRRPAPATPAPLHVNGEGLGVGSNGAGTPAPNRSAVSKENPASATGQNRTFPDMPADEGGRGTPAPHKLPADEREKGEDGVVMPASYKPPQSPQPSQPPEPPEPPVDRPPPRTPQEFAVEARELEALARQARETGDTDLAREIEYAARRAWKKAVDNGNGWKEAS